MEILREQYERSSDPIKGFVDECTENVGGEVTPKSVLFEAFCEYCKEHSIPMIYTMKGTFADRIKKIYVGGRARVDGKVAHVWQGCKLIRYLKYVPDGSTLTITSSKSAISVVEKRQERTKGNKQEKL